jgi:hypothetical protein
MDAYLQAAAATAAMALALTAAPAGGAPPVRAELDGPFHEAVQEEVAVSGSVVVGVAAAGALSGAATLAGLVIPAAESRVCLTVLSRDGVYFARNTFRVPPQAEGGDSVFIVLPFDGTRQRDRLAGYPAGDLAVRATPGSCDEASTTYLVATGGADSATIDVVINAFGANDVYYRTADGTEGDCAEFTEGRRTSYDYLCKVPRAALGDGRQQLVIERERYGRPLGEVTIELQLGIGP